MPEPITVWMVELDLGPDDVKGALALQPAALVFTYTSGDRTRTIRLADIRRVKRIMGSPVLLVRSIEADTKRITAFYFTKPPALHPKEPDAGEPAPTLLGQRGRSGQPSRRKQRRTNAGYLASASNEVSEDLHTWAKEVRAAVSVARQGERER